MARSDPSAMGDFRLRTLERQLAILKLHRGESPAVVLRGPPGVDGRNGRDGIDGIGKDGERGARGPQGVAGPPGPQGPIGPMPDHQWDGTRLRFQEPDGDWGKYVDLKGPPGPAGLPGGGGRLDLNKLPVADETLPNQVLVRQGTDWVRATFDQLADWLGATPEPDRVVIDGDRVVIGGNRVVIGA